MDAEGLIKTSDMLFNDSERTNMDPMWADLSEFLLTSQSGIFQGNNNNPGTKKTSRVYDSTAIQANHDLAAAIHGTLTNPATQWSRLRFKDEGLNNDEESTRWLEGVNNTIHSHLNESNFDTQVSKNYQAFTSLGTMVLFQEEGDNEEGGIFGGLRFSAWHLSEVAIAENKDGFVDTIYRKFKLTAKQALEKFPDTLSDSARELAAHKPFTSLEFVFCIMPRDREDVELDQFGLAPADKRPFAAYYVERKELNIVKEDGYYEFPVLATRWSTMPGEVYGRGPGQIALPDVRTLNKVKELSLHAIAKAIDPPMLATQRNVIGNYDMRPGKISIVKDINGLQEKVTGARFDVTSFAVEDLRGSIEKIFFLDKLLLPPRTETGEMTAYEVAQRMEQMQKVLGPTLSRLNYEFLSPLIVRTFKMLLRSGQLGEIPSRVAESGINLEINFVNQLARSQKIEEVTNITGWAQEMAFFAQLHPQVADYINADGIAKYTAQLRGVPEIAVTDDKVVADIRKQRAEQMQQQAMLDAGSQMSEIASKSQQGAE